MKNNKLTNKEVAQCLEESLDVMESDHATQVVLSGELQSNLDLALVRERKRLVSKYGENHTRVTKIDQRLVNHSKWAAGIRETISRNGSNIPAPDANAWRVYGTVFDSTGQGLPGLTLSLFNEKGEWAKPLGHVCADENGYYVFAITNKELTSKYKGKALFLTVTDANNKVLHREKDASAIEPGGYENRDIVLSSEVCPPPQDDNPSDDQSEFLVWGMITNEKRQPMAGLRVKAVDQDFTGENPLGAAVTTNGKGEYRIPYEASDFIIDGKESGGADIIIYVYDANGELVLKSEPYRNSPKAYQINLVVGK